MRAFIDVSIFSTPTKALGCATGVVDLPHAPALGQPIPWPKTALTAPALVEKILQSDLVIGVSQKVEIRNAEIAVSTEGLVHESEADARNTIQFLESAFGLIFCEYWK